MKRWFTALLFSAVLGAQPVSAPPAEKELANTEDLRVSVLSELATAEFEGDDAAGAERDARRLLQMAAAGSKEWNHDDMIHAANTVLGRVALQRGDLKEAKARLLASGQIQGSPVLGSFGPSMKLAQELLAAGERAAVFQYLELCRAFWKNDRGRIDWYVELVESEATPNLLSPYVRQGPSLSGMKAPVFRLRDLGGKQWTLDRLSGKVIAIDFWATWCRRCREELPVLEKLAHEFQARGAVLLAVNVGENEATVRRFVEETHVTLPVLLAGDDAMILNYRVEAFPTLAVIGREGLVAGYLIGSTTETELREALEKAFDQPPPAGK